MSTNGDRKKDVFAMVPRSVIESGLDDTCVRLYAHLDRVQGEKGWPAKGYAHIGAALGLQGRTVSTHVRHLVAAGVVALDTPSTDGRGSAKEVIRIIHNPARGRWSSAVVSIPPPPERAKSKSGAARMSPRRDAERRSNDRASGDVRVDEMAGVAEPVGATQPRLGLEERAPRALPPVRPARFEGSRSPASDAPLPRSPRSEKSLVEEKGEGEGPAEQVVRGQCFLCSEQEVWMVRLASGVELRCCDRHLEDMHEAHPNAEIFSLNNHDQMEAPFVVPPEGETQRALDLVLKLLPGSELVSG